MDRTKQALYYLSLGWSVIPVHIPVNGGCSCGHDDCAYPGKHPRISWRPYADRLPTEAEVTEWFDRTYYGSNLGVVTGRVSKLVVVDVDGDPAVFDDLGLPDTLQAETGRGGQHHFYRCESVVRSLGQEKNGKRGFAVGIDLKAEGGFVVLPPSLHQSGRRYRWTVKMRPTELDPKLLPVATEEATPSNGTNGWYHELLRGVSDGARSNSAAKLAGRYANLGLSIEETAIIMTVWNERNDPPMGSRELGGTIRSVYERHKTKAGDKIESIQQLTDWMFAVEQERR